MAPKSTAIEISAICGLFILLALWGIVWDITSGLLTSGIDGIMLALVCAMMAGIFFLIMLMELTKSGILPTPAFLRPAPKPAAAAKPCCYSSGGESPCGGYARCGAETKCSGRRCASRCCAEACDPRCRLHAGRSSHCATTCCSGSRSATPAPAPAKPATTAPAEPSSVPEKK